MSTDMAYSFEIPAQHKSIIKVMGVGGGGSNAVNHMYNQGIKDVEFVIANTDVQALKSSPVPTKLQLGTRLTEGLGAGANPEKGRQAAMESAEDIRELLGNGTKMIFITAGMGGGTGTGAAPVIAEIAKEMGILTVGIVTAPFRFEGKKKMGSAEAGIDGMREHCDTVLVILNDKLREIFGKMSMRQAFAEADNVLTTAAKGIAEIITVPGEVNVDFEDVKTVMQNAGAAVMGSAITDGEDRAIRAAKEALASPLLNSRDIEGAKKILLSIMSGEEEELQMDELADITDYMQDEAGETADVIFGHGIEPELGRSIRVTVIATGFEVSEQEDEEVPGATARVQEPETKVFDLESSKQITLFEKENAPARKPESIEPRYESPAPPPPAQDDRGYMFAKPDTAADEPAVPNASNTREEEPEDAGKVFYSLLNDYDIIDKGGGDKDPSDGASVEGPASPDLDEKRDQLRRQGQERSEKMAGMRLGNMSNDEIKEKWDVPAYQRKKVKLQDVPHSSEENVSRYNLNDDNMLSSNNRWLHDAVD